MRWGGGHTLVVAQPKEGIPHKDGARVEAAADLVDPGVVKVHPLGPGGGIKRGRLDAVPKGAVVQLLVRLDGVDGPAALVGEQEQLGGAAEDGALGRHALVAAAAPEHDERAEAEEDGRQGVRQPEADVVLAVDHGQLASQSADVDEQVEVVVDTGRGGSRVDDDALAGGQRPDDHPLEIELLDDQGVDIGLEATGTDAHEDDADAERAEGAVGVLDDGGETGDDEDDVAENVNHEGGADGAVAAEVAVGDPGTKERHGVLPERVEGCQGGGRALAEAEGAGLAVLNVIAGAGRRVLGELLLDEVCEDGRGAIVREALAQLDEGDGVDVPRDLVRDAPKSVQLLLGRVSAVGTDAELVLIRGRHNGSQSDLLLGVNGSGWI